MFRKLSYLMLLVMLAILPTAKAQVVGNLVQNPSFEEDEAVLDDPAWEAWCTWNPAEGAGSNATIVDTDAVDGTRSLMIEPKGAENWHFIVLTLPIPVEVGKSYTASFWIKAQEPRPFAAQFKATDNSVSWGYTDFQLTTDWVEYTFTSEAENAELKLELFCAGNEIPFWLDNVSVYEESEPLLLNGSFEEDEPIHNDEDYFHWWTWGYEAGLGSNAEIDESTSIDGTRSLRIEPLGSTNWYFIVAYSPILVELDKNYVISFWARAEEPRPVIAQLKATDNSIGAWGATEFQLTTDWAQYSYLSEVQIDDVKLEILCAGSEVPFWLDFVSVYLEGEEPGIGPKGSAEAGAPVPADGAIDVLRDITLSWKPGNDAVTHEVYFGIDFNDVNNADITDVTGIYRGSQDLGTASYTPVESPLEWNQTYYWRIDEINDVDPNSPWKGNVWSFTTTNHVVVDDFEDYDVGNKEIWWIWKDGLGHAAYDNEPAYPGNGTGSAVGDENSPSYMEETIVHSGFKSMPVSYDNSTLGLSEVTRTIDADWTQDEVLTLTLFYKGKLTNDAEPMYVALNDIAITHDNPQATRASGWNQWDILLQDFAVLGVDLANVNTMTIGFGNKDNPTPGGSGKVLIDDIRLYRSLPVEVEPLPEPVDPGTANLVAAYSFENNVQDVSGNGLDGTIIGNPAFVEGIAGMGLSFDGINDFVDFGNNAAFDITEQITLSAWVNPNDAGNGQHNPYVSKGDQTYAIKHANSNTIEFFIYDSGWHTANVKIDSSFNGEWHHVLGTYDGNELKTYVDGVLGATVAHQGSIDIQTHNLTIAQNSQETDRYYEGVIDEVKIYDRALTAAETRFLVGN
jgi:hypothetical protein